jgi:regulatory protein YycI of two-component signal transduction system YycFG
MREMLNNLRKNERRVIIQINRKREIESYSQTIMERTREPDISNNEKQKGKK